MFPGRKWISYHSHRVCEPFFYSVHVLVIRLNSLRFYFQIEGTKAECFWNMCSFTYIKLIVYLESTRNNGKQVMAKHRFRLVRLIMCTWLYFIEFPTWLTSCNLVSSRVTDSSVWQCTKFRNDELKFCQFWTLQTFINFYRTSN